VFTSTGGTPIEPSNLNQVWRRILRRADVQYEAQDGRGRGLHELRRTFATRLRDIGVPLEDVQRLGRWSSPQVLLALYAASDTERLRSAADAAVRALGGGRDET
jgi:integrase